jgi:hypothetical protein
MFKAGENVDIGGGILLFSGIFQSVRVNTLRVYPLFSLLYSFSSILLSLFSSILSSILLYSLFSILSSLFSLSLFPSLLSNFLLLIFKCRIHI